MSAICPECDSPIDVDEFDVDIGDELTCSECGSLLRVANDSPLEFDVADEEEDDLDEEEEEKDVDAEEKDDDDDDDEDDEDKVDDE
jgi:alpha-aminoadipate carrier protein LysW